MRKFIDNEQIAYCYNNAAVSDPLDRHEWQEIRSHSNKPEFLQQNQTKYSHSNSNTVHNILH